MMKIVKLVVCLGSVAMAWANAATKPYVVNFNNPAEVSGTELKPGAYNVEVAGDRVMIHGKNQNAECSVKVQEGDQKFSATTPSSTTATVATGVAGARNQPADKPA